MTKLFIGLENEVIHNVVAFATNCADHWLDRAHDAAAEASDCERYKSMYHDLMSAITLHNAAMIDWEDDNTRYNRLNVANTHANIERVVERTCEPFFTAICKNDD